jgi:hypothetical protein
MKTCPVRGCETVITPDRLMCHPDWRRLPAWARDDLAMLRRTEPDSALCRETVAVALAYLDDLAAREQVAG